jgi:hypothetical protein
LFNGQNSAEKRPKKSKDCLTQPLGENFHMAIGMVATDRLLERSILAPKMKK